jgi:hypothetical protein
MIAVFHDVNIALFAVVDDNRLSWGSKIVVVWIEVYASSCTE